MSARTKARKRALDILYAADVRQIPITESLASEATRAASEPDRQNSWLYAREIVDGVVEHFSEIDETIQSYSQGWTIARMPTIDRALLRIAIWEILYNDEVPASVAISEAVEAAKTLSTEDSSSFVNGVLGKVAESA
ncbi:transcription antitermination factor NusB [Herbiconiux sp. CPCC 205763]|uniref:Transcription antitermination protein NusB n=1 Tax=Herbiconiux aconitum TaxID=2970913 RepID=A0ABT2GTM9_9MICO|nr:transcription antitermination factor NusB [Herbiconiux aconitum]MCS5719508.1 transcription antitermination factor NusB [Herbiconiux aconitum]